MNIALERFLFARNSGACLVALGRKAEGELWLRASAADLPNAPRPLIDDRDSFEQIEPEFNHA